VTTSKWKFIRCKQKVGLNFDKGIASDFMESRKVRTNQTIDSLVQNPLVPKNKVVLTNPRETNLFRQYQHHSNGQKP